MFSNTTGAQILGTVTNQMLTSKLDSGSDSVIFCHPLLPHCFKILIVTYNLTKQRGRVILASAVVKV